MVAGVFGGVEGGEDGGRLVVPDGEEEMLTWLNEVRLTRQECYRGMPYFARQEKKVGWLLGDRVVGYLVFSIFRQQQLVNCLLMKP